MSKTHKRITINIKCIVSYKKAIRTTIFLNTKGTIGDINNELKIFLKAIEGIFIPDESIP